MICGGYKGEYMEQSTHPTTVKSQNWIIETLLHLMEDILYDKMPYEEIIVLRVCREVGLDHRTFNMEFCR